MFASFLVVFFVEFTNQLFKNGSHAMVVQAGMFEDSLSFILVNGIWTEIDIGRHKLLNNHAQNVRINHGSDLIAEFKLLQYFLDIGRKAIQICLKVRLEGLFLCTAGEISQQERRGIAEGLSSSVA